MKKYLFMLVFAFISIAAQASDCAIFPHGMGRSAFFMNKMAGELENAGYHA
jgi:D-arabinose 5-phosphate isomerase GutQ